MLDRHPPITSSIVYINLYTNYAIVHISLAAYDVYIVFNVYIEYWGIEY